MHISALEEYGLRCALQLAALPEGARLAASQVAEREGISVQYSSKILHLFRKAGIVVAARGIQGGFRLAKPATELSLVSLFAALNESEKAEGQGFCAQHSGQHSECVHLQDCSVRSVWTVLDGYFQAVLGQLTLAELLRSEASTRQRVALLARSEAARLRERLQPGAGKRAVSAGRMA